LSKRPSSNFRGTVMDRLTLSKGYLLKCNYGLADDNVFEIHLIGLFLTVPMAALLLWNSNLRRFYTPLARIVNASIIVSFISTLVFFWYWNFAVDDADGNCGEIFLSRIATILIMFGELHQIYVVAYSLGLGSMTIPMSSTKSYNLETVLNWATLMVVITVMLCYFFLRDVLMITELAWTVYVSVAQLYIIGIARSSREVLRDVAVVSVNDNSISIFEKLSIIQLILAGICVVYRIGTNIIGARLLGNIELTMNIIDQVCTLLFYLKTLLIKERTNVSVSVV
jgi:hypothetical protein